MILRHILGWIAGAVSGKFIWSCRAKTPEAFLNIFESPILQFIIAKMKKSFHNKYYLL